MSMNVKKGDAVKVIAGVDKGKTGQVLAVDTKSQRVVLQGSDLRTVKCFVKPRNAQEKGGIIEREATRVAHNISVDENGKKIKTRICKKCGASLDVKPAKAAKTAKKATKKTATKAKKTTEVAEN